MNKNVMLIIGAVVVVVLVIVGIVFLTGGDKEPKMIELSQVEGDYTMTVMVPEGEEEGTSVYRISTADEDLTGYNEYALIGDKIKVEFENTTHTFNTSLDYKADNGDVMYPTYQQYVDYIKADPYGYFHGEETVVEIDTDKRKAVQYEGYTDDMLYRVLNTDDVMQTPVFMQITPVNEGDDLATLMAQPEIKAVLDSIDFKVNG